MKTKFNIIILILLALVAMYGQRDHESLRKPASLDLNKIDFDKPETYTFKYKYKGNLFEVTETGLYQQAFSVASKKCYKHFNPKFISEEIGLDVIDVCANPRF